MVINKFQMTITLGIINPLNGFNNIQITTDRKKLP